MKAFGIAGPEGTWAAVGEALVAELDADGPIAVVDRRRSLESNRAPGVATTYGLTDEGTWTASGEGLDLETALGALSTDHAHAVVLGFPSARIPQVAIGDVETVRDPIVTFDSADAFDAAVVSDVLASIDPFETLESLVAAVKRTSTADRAGAIATFTGRVRRRDDPEDTPTEYLEFEKYDTVADERMAALSEELEARDGVHRVLLHHRTGVVESGEDIVFVVVLAGHREEAFWTVKDGIDRLKAEVPFFKKEVTREETYWVHERR